MNLSKPSYTFNEVCTVCEVKPYVLRFWESEFTQLDPVNGESGEKLYDKKDIQAVLKIKKLLFEDKLSIPKAKLVLMEEGVEDVVEEVIEEAPLFLMNEPKFVFEPPAEEIQASEELFIKEEINSDQKVIAVIASLKEIRSRISNIRESLSHNF